MVAGDISHAGQIGAYDKFNIVFNDVFTDSTTAPKKVMVMGNHDYLNGLHPEESQKRFCDSLGGTINTNVSVDGYHFIGVSNEAGDGNCVFTSTSTTWLRQQLEAAKKEDPNKPIFVTFHQHILNTVYLSDEWGNATLDSVLKDYPQAITFSGHSHAVLDDERSIYQKDYTCVGTCTLYYTELESGKVNGSVPPRANEIAQGLIGKVTDTAVDLERYDFHNDRQIKTDWVVDYPVDKSKFKYTDARNDTRAAPTFASGSQVTTSNVTKTSVTVSFNAATHGDFVQSYRIQAIDKTTNTVKKNLLYFSDFYLGLQRMASTYSFQVSGLDANKEYDIMVSAIESFGKESTPITTTVKTASHDNI